MSTGPRYSWQVANMVAQSVLEALSGAVVRAEVVGSIRRRADVVGDIEVLAVPVLDKDLLGNVTGSRVDPEWARWLATGRLVNPRINGPKAKAAAIPRSEGPPIPLDLYLTDLDNWGYMQAIRTGPAAYSKALVTPVEHGGLLESGYQCRGGSVYHNGVPVRCPTEREFLAIAGGWVDPDERGTQMAEQRRTVTNTRRAAHQQFKPYAGGVARKILFSLDDKAQTCEELEHALELKHQTVSAALTGLLKHGRVKVIGERANTSGRRARVYALAEVNDQ